MTRNEVLGLLTSRDARPVEVTNREGRSLFLLLGDHAGNRVPDRLRGLGLAPADLERHIALDLGVAELGKRLSRELDAPFVAQPYSRLVIDCNRSLAHPDSIAPASDGTAIPANERITADQRAARADAVWHPYHTAIADLLARRDRAGLTTMLVSLHSFTPTLGERPRPWHIGVLHGGGDVAFACAVLARLRENGDMIVGDNEPYRLDDTDFTVPQHAIATGRPYVELEIRQDEIARANRLGRMARRLADVLRRAAADCEPARGR